MSTPASSARAAPSPTIPSPNSAPASSTNGSSLNTPTSSSTCMSSFDSDLDSKINDLRRSWTAGGACAGPDLMYNCAEYATFLPRPNTSKERSSYEKFPESITTNGKVNQYDWIAPRSPPAVSGWAAGTQYGFVKGYPRAALREFYDRYPSGSNVEAPRQGPKAEDYQVILIPARPPLVDISNNIEMIQGLPPLMSPTIPAWPSSVPAQRAGASATVAARTPRPTPTPTPTPIPPRNHIGGKQPGKLPMSTLHGNNSFSSDDDSSDSGSDSDGSGNESDDHPMSEADNDPRDRKSIGDSGAGQSPLSHARKSYSDNGVSLLTSEQVDALPSRRRGMVLSKNPVVVKITIPRTHRQALKSIGHPQADGSASSNLTKHRLPDSSDSEDRKKPKPKSKGKNMVSESIAIPWKRLPDDSDEDSDERKKSKPKAKARRSSADSDSDKDTKPAASETPKGQTKSAEVRKVAQRRGSVDRPHSRANESKSLSPVMDRNRDRDRDRNGDRDKWKSYHSADEGEIEETSRSHKSFRDKEKEKDKEKDKDKDKDKDAKVKTESKDRSDQVSSKESHKNELASRKDKYVRNEPVDSKLESGHTRERSDSIISKDTRDRADPPQGRKDIKEESKEKSSRTEKPSSSASKDRKEDDSSRTAGSTKTDRSSTHGTTTAAPSSPSRRSSRDDAKDSGKSRGDKDSRDDRTTTSNKDARSSTSTSTGTTKDRARGRSRTRSRSRSPRGYYDRKRSPSSRDARDSKSTRDRREYDDDRSSSRRKKEGRQRDHSRDRNDRSSRGRSRDRSRDRFGRDRSRDRSADRGNSRDRKRARSRSRDRRTNRDTHSPPPSTRQDSHRGDSKQDSRPGLGRRESESHHGSSVSSASAARRPSQAVSSSIKEEGSATAAASSSSTAEAPSSTSGNAASAIKRVSIEDYQRKRGIVENKVETPKAAVDSPALASTTSLAGKVSLASNDSKDQPSSSSSTSQREQKSSSSQPKLSNEVSKKAADYYNTFRLLRAEGTTHKHNADKTLKTQNNPRLGAVQYFLGAIDFIAAFQANDKYLALSNPGQPDVAMKESVHSWETMRQFIFALTNQCHQNHLTGLDGLSALVEVLVYFKVYSCHATLLRKEMLRSGQFKTKVSKEDIANGATVAVSADLASRMMQNMEDWSHIQKRTEDVRQWLTPDIARAQFPETFARWLIHPDQVAAGTAGGYVPGTTYTAKIQWPLGTHLSLHTLMEMVVEAVKEFCQRHGLNGKPT
ncbi:hypothetical protein BGZ82_010527 [Podila clonocystis]|nr:hypothetical protein BGZ82_010527 [Podila clonocystis]